MHALLATNGLRRLGSNIKNVKSSNIVLENIITPWEKWLNSACVARCQLPQRPPIKKCDIKLYKMSMSITNLIFIAIVWNKMPLFEQKKGTCAYSLREKFVRLWKVLFTIFYSESKIREIAFHDKNIVTPWERWLNRARVACCQQPQRAPIKKAKTSSRAKCQYLSLLIWFSFQSVALNCHSLSKN